MLKCLPRTHKTLGLIPAPFVFSITVKKYIDTFYSNGNMKVDILLMKRSISLEGDK